MSLWASTVDGYTVGLGGCNEGMLTSFFPVGVPGQMLEVLALRAGTVNVAEVYSSLNWLDKSLALGIITNAVCVRVACCWGGNVLSWGADGEASVGTGIGPWACSTPWSDVLGQLFVAEALRLGVLSKLAFLDCAHLHTLSVGTQ